MMSVIGDLVAIDHWRQRAVLLVNVAVPVDAEETALDDAYDEALLRLDALASDGARPLDEPLMEPPKSTDEPPEVTSTMGSESYGLAVEAAREHILAGEVFQVVLSQRYDVKLDADPFDVYRVLRQINPSPYMYFLQYEDLSVVGASPEPMVQLLDCLLYTSPSPRDRTRSRMPSSA